MKQKMKSSIALHASRYNKAIRASGTLKNANRWRKASNRALASNNVPKQLKNSFVTIHSEQNVSPEVQKEIDEVVNGTAKLTTSYTEEDFFKSLGI
ncbi:hypothetical protein [Levilactobacillus tujiorum]|uniref:hypothetical protein n=1 Tax=Levilactobacillus tujiorum TaxID=2912243 RepID=UPI0014572F0B|nr:hypothetical protein [Levilactobacillus tujiorum]NLR31616.1 hypothetical protein [Levilactobacillus tujiorum]